MLAAFRKAFCAVAACADMLIWRLCSTCWLVAWAKTPVVKSARLRTRLSTAAVPNLPNLIIALFPFFNRSFISSDSNPLSVSP